MKTDGGGLRKNEGKLRFDLLHPLALEGITKVMTRGAEKYAERNWERGMKWTTVLQSLERHLNAIKKGEDYDQETGELHVDHLQCNAHFLSAYYHIFPQGDDRPKPWMNQPRIGLDVDEVLADWVGAWRKKFNIKNVPNSWYFDRQILKRFDQLRESGELDDFYRGLKPIVKEVPFVPHCYITSRPVDTIITEEWIDQQGFPTRPVFTVGPNQSKVEIAKEQGLELFVDDSWNNFVALNEAGITCYLMDTPHNRHGDVGHLRIKSLNDIF